MNKYTEFYQQIPLGDMRVILRMQGNILRRIKWSHWEKPYKFRISEKREITVREVGTASLPGETYIGKKLSPNCMNKFKSSIYWVSAVCQML